MKFDLPGNCMSGIRPPLVSTLTEPMLLALVLSWKLHGSGLAGKVKFLVTSRARPPLVLAGFTGMKVRRALTARGATKLPPSFSVRWMVIVVVRCGPAREA